MNLKNGNREKDYTEMLHSLTMEKESVSVVIAIENNV